MDSMNTVDVDRDDAARQRRGTVPRKHEAEHPDDIGVELAPRVTPQQLTELFACGYRGPTPSTAPQAEAILQQWRRRHQRSGADSQVERK
jgi:hypothetical protein